MNELIRAIEATLFASAVPLSVEEIQELLSNGSGTKSKSTTAVKKAVAKKKGATTKATPKRKRGRPAGSKNSTTTKKATPTKKQSTSMKGGTLKAFGRAKERRKLML